MAKSEICWKFQAVFKQLQTIVAYTSVHFFLIDLESKFYELFKNAIQRLIFEWYGGQPAGFVFRKISNLDFFGTSWSKWFEPVNFSIKWKLRPYAWTWYPLHVQKISLNTAVSVENLPWFETLTGYTAWPAGWIKKR